MSDMKRVVLVDDHQLIRDGIRQLLEQSDMLEVVAEAGSVKEGLRQIQEQMPDLVITDISMPGQTGFDLLAEATDAYPSVKFLVLSMHMEEVYVRKAIELGASGYLSKDTSSDELLEAVRMVCDGELYFSSKIARIMMGAMIRKGRNGESAQEQNSQKLTAREKEITALIAEGLSSAEIADKLFISCRTVENHRANIMNKLNVKNTIWLVRYYLENRHLFQE